MGVTWLSDESPPLDGGLGRGYIDQLRSDTGQRVVDSHINLSDALAGHRFYTSAPQTEQR